MDAPNLEAWTRYHDAEDETGFTPWADPGWTSYNGMSPEVQICDFFSLLVRLLKPTLVVETGVGQGYMTRAIVAQLMDGQRLLAFESDDEWRSLTAALRFWTENSHRAVLDERQTPPCEVFAEADLCFLDSDFPFRDPEIEAWHVYAKPGAVALIHDTGEHHPADTSHETVREKIVSLGMNGVFLHNPRGAFLALKP